MTFLSIRLCELSFRCGSVKIKEAEFDNLIGFVEPYFLSADNSLLAHYSNQLNDVCNFT